MYYTRFMDIYAIVWFLEWTEASCRFVFHERKNKSYGKFSKWNEFE